MPVRGRGWYKRPYRVSYTDRDGIKRHKEFHWSGPWTKEVKFLTSLGYRGIKSWVIRNEHGGVEAIKPRSRSRKPD